MESLVKRTFYYTDKKEQSVSAITEGTVKITDFSHPTTVTVNKEFSWYLVGHVEGAAVHNPGIAYWYIDGPASSISIIKTDGSKVDLQKGWGYIVYYKADKDVCTNIDSRNLAKGAIYPTAGTYTIWLLGGKLSDDEAAMGRLIAADLYEHVSSHIKVLTAAPVSVTVGKALTPLLPMFGGLLLLLAVKP